MLNDSNLLNEARHYFECGDIKKSLNTCLAYLDSYPSDSVAIRLKANLLGIEGRLTEAIEAISQIIDALTPQEPCDYFYRGRWLLENSQTKISCSDFNTAIQLSSELNDVYYVEAAHLHLAYAQAKCGNNAEAKKSLSYIDDESITYINDTLVTKSYIQHLLSRSQAPETVKVA